MGKRLTPESFPLQLRSFYGGQDRGRCLSVAVGREAVELTEAQVIVVNAILTLWLRGSNATLSAEDIARIEDAISRLAGEEGDGG